jgi:hypothetical protein
MADALKRSSFQNGNDKDQKKNSPLPKFGPGFENRSIESVDNWYEIKDPFGIFRLTSHTQREIFKVHPTQPKQSWVLWIALRVGIAIFVKLLWTAAIALLLRNFY